MDTPIVDKTALDAAGDAYTEHRRIPLIPGLLELSTQEFSELAPVEISKNGVVLADSKRMKIRAWEAGQPVDYVIALYVQRSPRTTDEQTAVDALARRTKLEQDARKAAEEAKREREVRFAADLARESAVAAFRSVSDDSRQALTAIRKALTVEQA